MLIDTTLCFIGSGAMAEAMIKKAKMRNLNLSTAETKELVSNPKEVAQQLLELVEPKAKISKEDLGSVS